MIKGTGISNRNVTLAEVAQLMTDQLGCLHRGEVARNKQSHRYYIDPVIWQRVLRKSYGHVAHAMYNTTGLFAFVVFLFLLFRYFVFSWT